jgi:hypothetical protein
MQRRSAHTPSAVCKTSARVSAQSCFSHPRRADARRSRYVVRYSPSIIRCALQARPGSEPRRAHARRSCACTFVHRKNRFLCWRTSASQYKSGGRKPPVVTITVNATAIRTYTVGGLQNKRACVCAIVFPTPTAGSRPPLTIRRSLFTEHYSLRPASATGKRTTAGSRPPLLLACSLVAVQMFDSYATPLASRTTAGSRPPLLIMGRRLFISVLKLPESARSGEP